MLLTYLQRLHLVLEQLLFDKFDVFFRAFPRRLGQLEISELVQHAVP